MIAFLVFGVLPAFLIYRFLLFITNDMFTYTISQYIFLYAQGLFVVCIIGLTEHGILSKLILGIMKWGFKTDIDGVVTIYGILSLILGVTSFVVDYIKKQNNPRKSYI